MLHALHVNDNNLALQQVSNASAEVIGRSQGYALFTDDTVVFDLDGDKTPVRQCRKTPLQINSRYWQQCAQSAISENAAGMRHAADLIWKHLGAFKEKYALNEMALVVPANYRDAHLQLLLGVAKANQLEITSLISKPAWCTRQARLAASKVVHVDVQMHQTVVSTVSISDTEVVLENAKVVAEVSLVNMQEALLQSLQACFIREDRFDPLHDAGTEQQLFDQLPVLVERAINNQKNNVGVEHNSKLYHAVIEPTEIKLALSPLLDLIEQFKDGPVLVDVNNEFELGGLQLHNVTWISDIDLLTSTFAKGANDDGNVVYRTSFPLLEKVQQDNNLIEEVAQHDATLNEQNIVTSSTGLASHVVLNGLAVSVADANITTIGTELVLTKKDGAGNLEKKLTAGELQIINDLGRTSISPNDRLISPLADGVITAIQML